VAEPSEPAASLLADRFAGHPRVTVVNADLEAVVGDDPFETIVLLNALEHLPDDDKALAQIREGLEPGGHVVLFVPAFEVLYGQLDRRIGHHRRYRRAELVAQVERAGFEVAVARYVNLPGFFSWLVAGRVRRSLPSPRLVRSSDRFLVPMVRAMETIAAPPFGQSLLVIARRRA
jgi:SAM-dependent methyltransferase